MECPEHLPALQIYPGAHTLRRVNLGSRAGRRFIWGSTVYVPPLGLMAVWCGVAASNLLPRVSSRRADASVSNSNTHLAYVQNSEIAHIWPGSMFLFD
jgi:hypothetical protein